MHTCVCVRDSGDCSWCKKTPVAAACRVSVYLTQLFINKDRSRCVICSLAIFVSVCDRSCLSYWFNTHKFNIPTHTLIVIYTILTIYTVQVFPQARSFSHQSSLSIVMKNIAPCSAVNTDMLLVHGMQGGLSLEFVIRTVSASSSPHFTV